MNSFQVTTNGNVLLEKTLVSLYREWCGKSLPFDSYGEGKSLQFGLFNEGGVTFFTGKMFNDNSDPCPLVSVHKAFEIMSKPYPKYRVTVVLTERYSAILVKGKDFIEVGCQKIPAKNVRELVKQMDELGV
jgi:hypothetical protein